MLSLAQVREHPVFATLNPEGKKFIKARYLPPGLNLFSGFNIHMAALIAFGDLPHIKTVPALQMMLEDFIAGKYDGKHTLVVDSSGNTAHGAARVAAAFGFKNVKLVVASDTPSSKVNILRALSSVEVIHPTGGQSPAVRAHEEALKLGHVHLNQYSHPGNPAAHERYTGPEIVRALGRAPAIVAIAMGSAGTAYGVATYFKKHYPETRVIGVRPRLGEQVPGARDEKKMAAVVTFPWVEEVAGVVEISRKTAFIGMRELWSAIEPQPGPTSGLAWKGLEQYLTGRVQTEDLNGATVAFLCPDDGRFYSDLALAELDTDQGLVSS